jgi:hypothetical protein
MKMQKEGHIIKGGDTVAYVVCKTEDETLATMADKALALSEVEMGKTTLGKARQTSHYLSPF